jgi:Autotransporter beta-domain
LNKRALMLTAAATALLSGHAYGLTSVCSTTTSTPGNCDITTTYGYPLFTGAVAPNVVNAQSTGGGLTVDTNGLLSLGVNPPQAPAITINSGTAAAPTIVTNATEISYQGITYATGVLLEEASVPATANLYGNAENFTGEFINSAGTIDMLGAGTNKTGILIAGGAYFQSSTSTNTSTTSVYSDASTGQYPNTAGSTTAPTGLGVFTGGNVIPAATGNGTSASPIAIYLESGSTLEVQGTTSYGINLIGPTYSTSPTAVVTPAGGASLIGDIDVGGSILMEPTTIGSTTATQNVAVNIAGWMQSAGQPNNPALVAALGNANEPYAMVGNLNILPGGVISSEGAGAQGVVVLGAMNGGIFNSGEIETFGTTTPSTALNAVDPEGGSAIAIGNNITGGIDNNGPSVKGQATASATISTVGTAPAIDISPSVISGSNSGNASYAVPITIGLVQSDSDYPGQFSLLNRGTISASSEDPNQNTNAVVMSGSQADAVTLTGGIFNSGAISAAATTNTLSATTSVTATALSIGSYTNVGTGSGQTGGTYSIINSTENGAGNGKITASVSGPDVGIATAINISQFASGVVSAANPTGALSLFNNGAITASATTTQPDTTAGTLNAYAVLDNSGTLNTIVNQGSIVASVTTLDTNAEAPINSGAFDFENEAIAISTASNSTSPVTINDTATASGPATITGDIYFGSKNGTLNVVGLNSTDFASIAGNIIFENTTTTHDVLNIGTAGLVVGQIVEKNGGSVDITIAQSGELSYQTSGQTNLNATTSVAVQKGVPLSVGNLAVQSGGELNLTLSQGYNVNVYSGVSVLNTQTASIGDPTGGIHPLTVSFGSFISTPLTATNPNNSASEFVLIDSKTPIQISTTELADLTTLYTGNNSGNAANANGIPYLFTSNVCTFNVANANASQQCQGTEPISATDSQIVLQLEPKTVGTGANQIPLTGYAAKMFPYVNQALINDNTLGAAMINDVTNKETAQAAYASFAPDVSGATRATAISLTDSATNVVAARQQALRMYGNQEGATTLWGQQFAERLSQANSNSLTGYNDSGFGFVLGMDDGDRVDGRYGGAFTFFTGGMSAKEPTSSKTSSEYYMFTGYTDWRGKGLFVDTQATVGYANLKGNRYLTLDPPAGSTEAPLTRDAQSQRPSELLAGSIATGGIFTAGSTVFMPQVDVDGLTMREEGYTEGNGGDGFDLHVQPYYADSLRAFVGADMRQDFNFGDFYLQPELRAGYRYDFLNGAQKLKANFASVNTLNGQSYNPFTIEGPDPGHGNLVLGGGAAVTTGAWSIGLNYDYVKAANGPSEQTGILTLIGRI